MRKGAAGRAGGDPLPAAIDRRLGSQILLCENCETRSGHPRLARWRVWRNHSTMGIRRNGAGHGTKSSNNGTIRHGGRAVQALALGRPGTTNRRRRRHGAPRWRDAPRPAAPGPHRLGLRPPSCRRCRGHRRAAGGVARRGGIRRHGRDQRPERIAGRPSSRSPRPPSGPTASSATGPGTVWNVGGSRTPCGGSVAMPGCSASFGRVTSCTCTTSRISPPSARRSSRGSPAVP